MDNSGAGSPFGKIPISWYASALAGVSAGIVHALLAPVTTVAGVTPGVAIVGVCLAACLLGAQPGAVTGFFAGAALGLFGRETLGVAALGLTLVGALGGAAAARAERLGVWRLAVVPAVVFAASAGYDVMTVALGTLLDARASVPLPPSLVLVAAALNAAIATALFLPARALTRRLMRERPL